CPGQEWTGELQEFHRTSEAVARWSPRRIASGHSIAKHKSSLSACSGASTAPADHRFIQDALDPRSGIAADHVSGQLAQWLGTVTKAGQSVFSLQSSFLQSGLGVLQAEQRGIGRLVLKRILALLLAADRAVGFD